MLEKLAPVILGGALGATARYLIGRWSLAALGTGYPWGTTIVNVLGATAFGVVWAYSEGRAGLSPAWRLLLLTGFMGSFTTFSTFAFEGMQMITSGRITMAAGHIFLQNVVGLLGVYSGIALGHRLS